MDADHLDIYGDRESIVETGFQAFAERLKPGGALWVRNGLQHHFDQVKTFGLDEGQARSENISVRDGYFTFDYVGPETKMQDLQFSLPGRHNVENATLAITVALSLGVKEEYIREALMSFKGIKRRFDIIVRGEDKVYIDDYAHHPTELKAAIGAARQLYPDRELCGIFQPHLYSRTRDFVDGFAEALDALDVPILMNIYPAREEPIPGVSTQIILDRMKNQRKQWLSREEILAYVTNNPIQVLMTLGAGDIDRLITPLSDLMQ